MPPKKKGKSKVKSGGLGGIIDGVDITQMSKEQLELFSIRIKEENEREREERNYFQLERDKLHNFWEITRNELEEVKAKLRNKDREIEEANENNEEEIKVYKQKVKLLQFEHQNSLTECKAESLVALKLAQDKHIAEEDELIKNINQLKKQIREEKQAHSEQIKKLKVHHSKISNSTRQDFESKAKEYHDKYEIKLKKLIEEQNVKQRMEISEIEERKNSQIKALLVQHEKAFIELKNYYNDIILNNLALISCLKDQMEVLRNENDKTRKELAIVITENSKLSKPLKQAELEVEDCKKQLENYKNDKLALSNIKAKYFDIKKMHEKLKWENEALELSFENLTAEKDELYSKCQDMVLSIHQKSELKMAILQKKIQTLTNVVEYRDVIFDELSSSNIDVQPQRINRRLEEMLSNKNALIKELQSELTKVSTRYNDLLELCKGKFLDFGISTEELNFSPVKVFFRTPEESDG